MLILKLPIILTKNQIANTSNHLHLMLFVISSNYQALSSKPCTRFFNFFYLIQLYNSNSNILQSKDGNADF